jgi:hypothetical protein
MAAFLSFSALEMHCVTHSKRPTGNKRRHSFTNAGPSLACDRSYQFFLVFTNQRHHFCSCYLFCLQSACGNRVRHCRALWPSFSVLQATADDPLVWKTQLKRDFNRSVRSNSHSSKLYSTLSLLVCPAPACRTRAAAAASAR